MAKPIYANKVLQQKLTVEIDEMLIHVKQLADHYSLEELNLKPTPNSWSANECFHHLNLTFQSYLPSIQKGKHKFKGSPSIEYRSGFIGDRMIRGMAPSLDGTIPERRRTKTFKKVNPDHQITFVAPPIDVFLAYNHEFKAIIDQIYELNLEKIKVKSLVGNIIKFKLGDALQVVHVHNRRHIIQAKNALKSISKS